MDVPMLADQQELFDISSEQTQDVIWKTLPKVMDGRDGFSRENQENLCHQCNLMIMMMMMMMMKCKQSLSKIWTRVAVVHFVRRYPLYHEHLGFTVRSRKNCKPLFSVGNCFCHWNFWNHTFHPIRMTHAILPGHTSLGTIKGSARNTCDPSLFFSHSSRLADR